MTQWFDTMAAPNSDLTGYGHIKDSVGPSTVPATSIPNPWFDYPASPAPCPGCGRCPYCGKRNVDPYFYPATPSYPPYKITYVCSVNGIS